MAVVNRSTRVVWVGGGWVGGRWVPRKLYRNKRDQADSESDTERVAAHLHQMGHRFSSLNRRTAHTVTVVRAKNDFSLHSTVQWCTFLSSSQEPAGKRPKSHQTSCDNTAVPPREATHSTLAHGQACDGIGCIGGSEDACVWCQRLGVVVQPGCTT
jgi:hypothetical protein